MAAPKRTKFERERDLQRVTDLYLRGKRQYEIANELKVSQQQVSYDIKVIQERWRSAATFDFGEAQSKELARIDELERTYWAEWERSREGRTKTRSRKSARDIPSGEGTSQLRSAEQVEETEERLGDPRYLQGVQWCIERRCKILGLDAPLQVQSKTELTGKDGERIGVDIASVIDADAAVNIFDILSQSGALDAFFNAPALDSVHPASADRSSVGLSAAAAS